MEKQLEMKGFRQLEIPPFEEASLYDICLPSLGRTKETVFFRMPVISGGKTNGYNEVFLPRNGMFSAIKYAANAIMDGQTPPLRLYYVATCVRNEDARSLNGQRFAFFKQFGAEIYSDSGTSKSKHTLGAIDALVGALGGLSGLGIKMNDLFFRINDVRLFDLACLHCGIRGKQKENLRDALDSISRKKTEGKSFLEEQERIKRMFGSGPPSANKSVELFAETFAFGSIDDVSGALSKAGAEAEFSQEAKPVEFFLKKRGVRCAIDATAVRNVPDYYTGFVFQVDLLGASSKAVEIAGGGSYDKQVRDYLRATDQQEKNIDAVGWAMGLDRLAGTVAMGQIR